MEEQIQVVDSGVTSPVAGEQVAEVIEAQESSPNTETGVTPDVAGQEDGEKQNNGQAIQAEIARREAKMQKKYEEQYGSYQKNLERTAKYYGYENVDSYVEALEQAERQRDIQAEAERLGIDESVVLEHLQPLREKVERLTQKEQEYQQLQQSLEIQKELVTLRDKYKDFDQYTEKIVDIVGAKGYSLEDAYVLASYQDKMSRLERDTEAKTIKSLQENAASTPGALGQGDVDHQVNFSALPRDAQRKMIEEVKSGTRKSF